MAKKLIALLALAIVSICCQDDTASETTVALDASSDLTAVLKAMSVNETVIDNVLDSTSCYKVRLPVNIIVNGQSMTIISEADYAAVEAVFNASETDENEISFVFPIKLEEPDYTEIAVRNQQQLENLKASCEQVAANYISDTCTEIVFPVTIYGYNSGFQMQGTNVVTNNKDLYTIIKTLGPDQYYSIGYPVSLKVNKGVVVVNNNDELLETIKASVASCQ